MQQSKKKFDCLKILGILQRLSFSHPSSTLHWNLWFFSHLGVKNSLHLLTSPCHVRKHLERHYLFYKILQMPSPIKYNIYDRNIKFPHRSCTLVSPQRAFIAHFKAFTLCFSRHFTGPHSKERTLLTAWQSTPTVVVSKWHVTCFRHILYTWMLPVTKTY